MSNIGQGTVLILLTNREAQFIPASLAVGRRTHCHSHESPPASSWHFPCLLQTCNYTPASLLTLLLLSSPAQDLSLSSYGFVLVDIQSWLKSRAELPLLISNEVCIARGAQPACPIWLLVSLDRLLLLIRLTRFPQSLLLGGVSS